MKTDTDDLSTMTMPLLEFQTPKGEMYALRSGNKAKLVIWCWALFLSGFFIGITELKKYLLFLLMITCLQV